MANAHRADGVIAKSPQEHRKLIASAFDCSKLIRIDDGFEAVAPQRTSQNRGTASIGGDQWRSCRTRGYAGRTLLCTDDDRPQGIRMLVESVRVLVARYPTLRFWFIGDGPYRDSMYDYLRGEGVQSVDRNARFICRHERTLCGG